MVGRSHRTTRRPNLAALAAVVVTALLGYTCAPYLAWVSMPAARETTRRQQLLFGLGAAGLLGGAAGGPQEARAAGFFNSERFDGSFTDPKHTCAKCIRNINAEGGIAMITLRNSDDEPPTDIYAAYEDKTIVVDFSGVGGPEKLKGTFFKTKDGDKGIKWADGNVWEKMEYKVMASPYEVARIGKAGKEKMVAEGALTKGR